MDYRINPKTGDSISLLGVGTMRLPQDGPRTTDIDEAKAIAMIRRAIDAGVNYVDTAYMYHGNRSEIVVGKALRDGYRERTYLADKLPVWDVPKTEGGAAAILEEQLQKVDTDRFDYYLLHNLTVKNWNLVQEHKLLKFLENQRAAGRIRQIGFSFHDEEPVFREILDGYDWDFCQIQFNYMDTNYQAGISGLKYAGAKGIPVVVMEPQKGGRLAQEPPPEVAAILDRAPTKRLPADWAFRYVADHAEVLTILSGMSTPEQLEENLKLFEQMPPGLLTAAEREMIDQVAETYRRLVRVDCTTCRYCQDCPEKIKIPEILELYNEWHRYHAYTTLRRDYGLDIRREQRASACTQCGLCEELCPQHLPIRTVLSEMAEIFEPNRPKPEPQKSERTLARGPKLKE